MIDETENDSPTEESPPTTQDQGSESPGSEAADSPAPAGDSEGRGPADADPGPDPVTDPPPPAGESDDDLLNAEEEPEQPAEEAPTLLGKVEALHKLIQDGEMMDDQAAALYKKVTVALDYAKIVTATE